MARHADSASHPLLFHGFIPSLLGHAALLALLALVAVQEPKSLVLFDIDFEPVQLRSQHSRAPRPPPAGSPAERHAPTSPLAAPAEPSAKSMPGSAPSTAWQAPRPAAAQAGRVVTAPADSPVDFSMVQGDSGRFAGGVTTSRGSSAEAVYDAEARDQGVPGRSASAAKVGKAPPRSEPSPAPQTPRVDRSRAAVPSSTSWQCPFPREADRANVNYARVRIVVSVGPDGRATRATVLGAPKYGFGPAAVRCAMRQRYRVGLGPSGAARVSTTAPILVTFVR